MRLTTFELLVCGFWPNLAQGSSSSNALAAKKCPIELNPLAAPFYKCARHGWVEAPEVISTSSQPSLLDCASNCLLNRECQGLRYIEASSTCYTYSKTFFNMYTSFENYKPGLLYDRNCFSNDCQVQAACNATAQQQCRKPAFYGYERNYFYGQYACSYGYTAFLPPADKYATTSLYNGTMSICYVVYDCIDGRYFSDVHYHRPSQQWVCTRYLDNPGGNPEHQFRYARRNDSVGAGYGFQFLYYTEND